LLYVERKPDCSGESTTRNLYRQIRFWAMQLIDESDPRPAYVQIAASIRAAILSGELAPGERIPSGPELAGFFGVARLTVTSAVRILQDEGFVRTKAGSGVYVRERASQPVLDDEEHPLANLVPFLHEAGHLKNLPRSGWLLLGIPQPESVAEHSFRVGIVGMVLAALEGADIGRVAAMALLHDSQETRIGDQASVNRAFVKTATAEAVTVAQTTPIPDDVGEPFRELVAEFEAAKTPEARVARDADKLETLLQALEYQARGHDTGPWQETSIEALRTESARQLARAIKAGDTRWWAPFAASYHELRRDAKAHPVDIGQTNGSAEARRAK
jgi:putative hydrolase of HD superfamily